MPQTLKELHLHCTPNMEVVTWLNEWVRFFEEKIGDTDKAVQAKKVDFKNDDLFYFTSCADIIGKDPMFKDPETEQKVIRRKMQVYMWLFLKYLLDQTDHIGEGWKICSHCGKKNCELDVLPLRMGHYQYCPDCGKTAITVFPTDDNAIWEFIRREVWGDKPKPAGQYKTFLKDAVKLAIKESKNLCLKPTGQDKTFDADSIASALATINKMAFEEAKKEPVRTPSSPFISANEYYRRKKEAEAKKE